MAKREYNEARARANSKYIKANIKQFTVKLNKKTDEDIIARLEEVPSKQGYIKQLIREDINR